MPGTSAMIILETTRMEYGLVHLAGETQAGKRTPGEYSRASSCASLLDSGSLPSD